MNKAAINKFAEHFEYLIFGVSPPRNFYMQLGLEQNMTHCMYCKLHKKFPSV